MARNNNSVSSAVQKELQNMIIAVAVSKVCRMGTMTDIEKKKKAYDFFHGTKKDNGCISLVDQFMQGRHCFADGAVFDEVPVTNPAGAEDRELELHVKHCLTRDETTNLVVGKQITKKKKTVYLYVFKRLVRM